jgi:hypothetical protein
MSGVPGVGGSPPPDSDKIAQALHLRRTTDMSVRQIAEAIGVKSHSTVLNYIAIGEQAERWFPALTRAEIGARVDLVLSELMDRGLRRLGDRDAVFEKVSPAIVQVLQEISKRHGLYAPSRSVVELADDPIPDQRTTAAIRAALDQLALQSGDDHDDGTDPGDGT